MVLEMIIRELHVDKHVPHVALSSPKKFGSESARSLVQYININIWLQCHLDHSPGTTASSVGKMEEMALLTGRVLSSYPLLSDQHLKLCQ